MTAVERKEYGAVVSRWRDELVERASSSARAQSRPVGLGAAIGAALYLGYPFWAYRAGRSMRTTAALCPEGRGDTLTSAVSLATPRSRHNAHELRTSQAECRCEREVRWPRALTAR